jgi:hypothetical protein
MVFNALLLACLQPGLFAGAAQAQGEIQARGGRVTNGYVEQQGWQAGMIRGCPNLSHFHWQPMTTMLAAPVVIPVSTTTVRRDPTNPNVNPNGTSTPLSTGYGESKPVTPNVQYTHTPYVHPTHLAPPERDGSGDLHGGLHNNDLAGRILPRHYIKPIHAPLPLKLPSDGSGDCFGRLADDQVKGQLLNRKAQQAVAGRLMPPTLQYGSYSSGGSGSGGMGQTTRTAVSARLSNPRGSLLNNY